ncbi:toprim domain-containing protein [Nocardia huaxiensis]|uniref:Toprim domain-containing protein n=1 Tax=Nocardia huaxiensis TaxID=2755382 RepID=A0A7D6Z594_9NOCA|nr:toprim domain-containing protein [Nocardia huaxiensis]QLY33286.1 toprim domain-containing protein [Nocardia huaxiensis]
MTGNSSGASFDRVVDALRQVTTEAATQSGQWTKFRCPVPSHGRGNGDRNPSLGVKYDPRREKTIVTCFSGCDQDNVLVAADLRVRDLFDHLPDRSRTDGQRVNQRPQPTLTTPPARKQQPHNHTRDLGAATGPKRRAAVYTYTTATNDPVGQVIRYEVPHERGVAKDFSQRRWDPDRRMWAPGGFAPVLYQAPTVAWAVAQGHPILVCEGEKDVDRAIQAGYPATCNVGGAGKFRPEHAQQLRGAAHVVIVADRDTPGYTHAAQVYDRVSGLVNRVDVMHAAHGKDLSDHFDAGHGINDLHVIDPSQLAPYRSGAHEQGRSTGPRRPASVSTPPHPGWTRPEMDWGLDR